MRQHGFPIRAQQAAHPDLRAPAGSSIGRFYQTAETLGFFYPGTVNFSGAGPNTFTGTVTLKSLRDPRFIIEVLGANNRAIVRSLRPWRRDRWRVYFYDWLVGEVHAAGLGAMLPDLCRHSRNSKGSAMSRVQSVNDVPTSCLKMCPHQ